MEPRPIRFEWEGHRIRVQREWTPTNTTDVFLYANEQRFFLGPIPPGTSRRDVKAKAIAWLEEHRVTVAATSPSSARRSGGTGGPSPGR